MLFVFFLGMGSSTYAQFLINENFRGKSTDPNNLIVPGDGAILTVGNVSGDKEGDGWFRLTNDSPEQKGYFYVNKSFPSDKGVFVDFEYTIWRTNDGKSNSGAGDGFTIFLFDANVLSFKLGSYGGALGYAPRITKNEASYSRNPTKIMTKGDYVTGLSGGFIGLGFDVYGNYNNTEGGKQGEKELKNSMVLRGKTIEDLNGNNTYNIIQSSNVILGKGVQMTGTDKIDYGKVNDGKRPNNFYRRVQVEISKVDGKVDTYNIIVRWATTKGGEFKEIYKTEYTEKLPKDLKVGFAASTGWAVNNHEVRDLFATTPGGVMIEKLADKSIVNLGEELTYTINLKGQNTKSIPFVFTDDFNLISDFFEVTSIEVNKYNNPDNKVTLPSNTKNLKDVAVTLGRLGTISFTIKGKVKKAPGNTILKNTAVINKSTLPSDIQKLVSDNQLTSSTSTQVNDPNFCGCPEGAKQIVSTTNGITVNAGDIYCVSGNVSIGSLTINKGGTVYVQEGAKLNISGNYTQNGGIVSICPYGGVFMRGSATFGNVDGGDTKLILKENAYFSVTGSLTHVDPGNGKALYEMYGNSYIEVCGPYSQFTKRYASVVYKGTDNRLAYFINKNTVSGDLGVTISDSDKIAWLAFQTPAHIKPGKALYCENANPTSCAYWPKGLNPNNGQCNQVEELIDRTEPVGPDFCDYPGDKFISGYHSTIIKTATGFQIFGEQTKPSGSTTDHFLVPTDITFANGFNYEGSPLMATIGSQYYANNQNFLLTTKGLYVWGTRVTYDNEKGKIKYAVIHPDLVTSNAFQKIDLPTGVTPKDVKYMTASNNVLAILLNNGQIKISGTKTTLYGDGTSTLNKEWHTVSTKGNTPLLNVEMMKMHATGGIAYTQDGKYYAWGTTVFDGVKRIDNSNYSYAVLVKAPFTSKPVMLGITGIGEDNYVSYFALSEDGKVYSLGSNTRGQLGIGSTTESLTWQVVKKADGTDLTEIKYLSAQDNSSYEAAAGAINKYGRVYFWGANGYNMLGQSGGDLQLAKEPQGLNDNRVVYVEVGGHTSMIVNDQNKYCYVGHKIYGSMGDGIAADSSVHTFDCENTPNVIDMCGKIEIVPEPGLLIEKTGIYVDANGDQKVNVGDVINYKFKVTNTGNTGLKNITITDDKITVKGGPINLAQNGLDTDTFTGTYTITQKDIERGGVLNIASANGEGEKGGKITTTSVDPNPNKPKPTDPNYPVDPRYPEDNDKYKNCLDCTVTILEQQPSITLVKVGVVDEDVDTKEGNGVINYTFTITNTGNVSLTLKDFKDSIIPGFTPIYKTGEGTGTLEIGKTWTATATYTITDADVDAEKVENRAEVTGTAPKGKTTKAESKDEKGLDKPTITPVEGGGPLITNPHIYHKVQ
jgi:alpha-tubulin suppressor-like RCC1 family protein